MLSNHLILCCPLLLLPPIFPSISIFSNESALCIRWPKFWSFTFSIRSSSEYSGLISFKIWLVWFPFSSWDSQARKFKNIISSALSLLMVQLSYPCMTTGKTIALTRHTFVGKVMSLLYNMVSRLVIAFLPRSKGLYFHGCSHHLQWFWSPSK